ncbi:hypothetical protein HII31_02426 [Pseudocercospora fuligena]|uniref:Vps72/YL1 C-terminal domain-containing protein n=1 Tax=Pseudocercospora fuligena TaxID=685502 RepID=A0A8H6RRV8_9PEZI|nr:hypothetical protein HII31_02426 [Pseudocercospora fuligena]
MSSDDDSSESEGEDVSTTGLIATRAKRATAGNLYATLRQNLDDEELQKELLAEDEDDVGDYEGSDKDDDDAMSSSGDEDDQGPPAEGDKEDLEGEKELKKAERAQNRKKRKLEEAKKRIPNWQKKRVKLADDAKAEDGQPAKPKKKSERSNWLPTAADAPTRQSSRASAVANREMVHTNLKESNERSEKQKTVMSKHKERLKASQRAPISQEERFAKAARIEKETAREFGRWEREEAERQRIREEQLAAKRKRGIDGPVIRHWSGSVLWEGDKIKNKRLHGSTNVDEIEDKPKEAESSADGADGDVSMIDSTAEVSTEKPSNASSAAPTNAPSTPVAMSVATPGFAGSQPLRPPIPAPQSQPAQTETPSQPSWLDGIHAYANQPDPVASSSAVPASQPSIAASPYTPSAPSINAPPDQPAPRLPPIAPQPITGPFSAPSQPSVYHGWPASTGYGQFQIPTPYQQPLPPAPPPPPIKEQARRSLIILEQFENLETTDKGKKSASKSKDASLEPSQTASTLLPDSYPSFNQEQTRYLTGKLKKLTNTNKAPDMSLLPNAPVKQSCAFTPFPAKFRDPKTGLPYADMLQYKNIQRILNDGCQWSSLLGCWTGPRYGSIGRSAVGVPEGFCRPVEEEQELSSAGQDVKVESTG